MSKLAGNSLVLLGIIFIVLGALIVSNLIIGLVIAILKFIGFIIIIIGVVIGVMGIMRLMKGGSN